MNTMHIIWTFAVAMVSSLALTSCSDSRGYMVCEESMMTSNQEIDSSSDEYDFPTGPSFTDKENEVILPLESFAARFMNELSVGWKESIPENKVVSPLGMSLYLAMLANGSSREAQAEIQEALGCDDIRALNETAAKICKEMPHKNDGSMIAIANSLWLNQKWSCSNEFASTMEKYFNADISPIGDDPTVYVEEINNWVENNTYGMITNFLQQNSLLEMMIINTTYVSTDWKEKFDNETTRLHEFHNLDGTSSQTEMMTGLQDFSAYCQDTKIGQYMQIRQADNNTQLNILIPEDFENADFSYLTPSHFLDQNIMPSSGKATLIIPKMDFTTDLLPLNTLEKLGIETLFKKNGLTSILDENMLPASVNGVLQKTHITFDEEGCKAAAATGGTLGYNLNSTPMPKEIKLDRPFIFKITAYGITIAAGQVVKF